MSEPKLRQVYESHGYEPNIIDELVALSYDVAREHNLTVDEAVAIIAADLERMLKRHRESTTPNDGNKGV